MTAPIRPNAPTILKTWLRAPEPALTAPILVAGAGIGGLAAALTLARAGRAVQLVERAPAITEIGAGLQIAPNAGRILARLGLGPEMDRFASEPRAINVRRGRDGDILARLDLSVAPARWGAPFRLFHRADLQQILLRAVAAESRVALRTGARVVGFGPGRDARVEVVVETAEGPETLHAAGLVGADGERSAVRALLAPGASSARNYAGVVAWRALVPAAQAPEALRAPETHIWLSPGAHVVHYPLRDGGVINVVLAIAEAGGAHSPAPAESAGVALARDLAARGVAPMLCALIEAGEIWRRWPFFAQPALKRWSVGAATLLGDAAHPMVPFLAQGAAQAIEDADALGRAFAATPEAPVARVFADYERARIARASRVVRASRRQGDLDHLGGLAAVVRDLGIRALGGRGLLRRNAWLYR